MKEASKFIVCAFILHNLAIKFGDNGEELPSADSVNPSSTEERGSDAEGASAPLRERRRNQLLQFFQRN